MCSCFKNLGAEFTGHIHHDSQSEVNQEITFRLNNANGIFFAGGNQLKLTSIYGGTPMMTALKILYIYNDIVIGGTGAGAMAMSTPMIYAGSGKPK
ncbi:Type 1 glutamine amidotransferase-like domain-containing protein [Pedobacter agri]|uniref:Type 1 glutamine amidotransferase-like domain-containing protein n=1 Tax=Pedobacter agri TaxID=454586 RepID=UPI000E266BB5